MKITNETNLRDFEFWSGAREIASRLTDSEMDQIESMLEELYSEGMTETQLNDLFWFDSEWVCSLIGENEESILEREEF